MPPDERAQHPALAVIGGGNMCRAILQGGIHAGVVDPARVCVAEPDAEKHPPLRALGVHVLGRAAGALRWLHERAGAGESAQVLLAVKPQMLPAVADEVRPALASWRDNTSGRPDLPVILSILAGTTTATLADAFAGAPVVRIMPNTPAQVSLGMSALCPGATAGPTDDRFAMTLFSAIGDVIRIDESLMDAFTAVAGSGPAYLFYLAEGMERGAVACGIDAGAARRIVHQTLIGAATLLGRSEADPAELRAAVTSKGGTTAAGIAALDSAGVLRAQQQAIIAARDRGRELGL